MIIETTFKEKDLELIFYYDENLNLDLNQVSSYLKASLKSFFGFVTEEYIKNKKINLNLNICDEEKIQQINNQYLGKDKITDVLSFPLQESIRNKRYDSFQESVELGDIFICHEKVIDQAQAFKLTYEEEFIHLFVHGLLHLCGFDHEINEDEKKLMEDLEERLLLKTKSFL